MGRTPLYLIVLVLVITACTLATMRHLYTGLPLLPGKHQSVWLVEAGIEFKAYGGPVSVSLDLPDAIPGFRLLNEQAASPGYGFAILSTPDGRRGEWTKREASGRQVIFYQAQFATDPSVQPPSDQPNPAQDNPITNWDLPTKTAASQILLEASERSVSATSLTRELIKTFNQGDLSQNAALLLSRKSRGELLVAMLSEAGYAARLSDGLYLEDARRRQRLQQMLEVYENEQWHVFNLTSGEQGVPENLLLWKRGGVSFLDVEGGKNSSLYFSIIRQDVPLRALAQARMQESGFQLFSISSLPLEEQSMFKMLLLLPIGALVVVFMRIIVGIKTAGTFMPVLIAVAFLQTSLLPGLISFVLIVAAGLLMRSYLSNLNLLLVARIATLVILVVFLIALLSIIGAKLGLKTGMTVTFFPMIIIAWTIERMSILWEEEGPHEVVIQGGGSLMVAVFAYLLMSWPVLAHLSFNFPELHLITLAMILVLGQYTGYRLTELRRFKRMI